MALSDEQINNINRSQRGLLEVSASQFYDTKVRAHIKDMLVTCKTDPELTRTLTSTLNKVDGEIVRQNWGEVFDGFNVLNSAITDKSYFNGVIAKASEEEKNKVRKLIELISDLFLLIQAEKPAPEEEIKTRQRLDYNEDEADPYRGQNGDYSVHNMSKLAAPDPDLKTRIPNR